MKLFRDVFFGIVVGLILAFFVTFDLWPSGDKLHLLVREPPSSVER